MNMQNALCFAGGLAVGSLAAFIFCRLRAKKADTEKVMDGEFVPVNDAPVDDWSRNRLIKTTVILWTPYTIMAVRIRV